MLKYIKDKMMFYHRQSTWSPPLFNANAEEANMVGRDKLPNFWRSMELMCNDLEKGKVGKDETCSRHGVEVGAHFHFSSIFQIPK